MKLKKKIKFKSQTVVFHTLWGYFCLFFWTHRFKFLCSFEHLRVFLGTMLRSVDGRGVWKRQYGAPQRWSRGWILIEGIVEHPCVRYSCSICRPVSNDSIDGTDTWKVTLCTNSCQDKRRSWVYISNRLTLQMCIKVGCCCFFYKFTFISLITGLYCGFVISKSLWNSITKSWLTFLDEFVSDLPRKDGRITTLVLLYLHHHGGRGYFRFTSAYRTSPVTHNWVDVWSWKNWNQNHLISLT